MPKQMSAALVLYAQGNGPAAIYSHLSTNSPSPSLRTVNHWVSKFKRVDSDLLKLDVPYEWYLQEHDSANEQERNLVYRMLRIKENATVREVYWWRKINEMGNDIPDKNLISIAQECVINQHKEILAINKLDWAKIWDKIQGCYQEPTIIVRYSLLPGEYIICCFQPTQRIPDWVVEGELLSITRTPEQVTVISEEVPLPPDIQAETGWFCLKVPFGQRDFFSAIDQFDLDYRVVSIKGFHYFLCRDISVDRIKKNVRDMGIRLEEVEF